jgi:hypothetical protein
MKKVLTLILLIGCMSGSYAQLRSENVDVQWSKPQKTKKNLTIQKIAADDGKNTFMVMSKVKEDMVDFVRKPILQKYDQNFNLLLSQPIKTNAYPGVFILEDLISFQDELLMVYSTITPLRKDHKVFFQKINKATLKPIGPSTPVASSKIPNFIRVANLGRAKIQLSPNEEKLMLLHEHAGDRTKPVRTEMAVYNAELKKDWSYVAELPYTHQYFELMDGKLDNDGKVHLMGRLNNKKREVAEQNKPLDQFEVLSYGSQGKTKQTTLTSENGHLTDLILEMGIDGELICAGFYTENDSKSSGITGTYVAKLDPLTYEKTNINHSRFTEELLYEGASKKQKKSLDKKSKKGDQPELSDYRIDQIHIHYDGSFALVAEQKNYGSRTSTSYLPNPGPQGAVAGQGQPMTQTSTTRFFSYRNLLVAKFDPHGNSQWTSKILKNQSSQNDYGFYSSYAVGLHNDKMYFIFNDHPDNFHFDEKKGVQAFGLKLGKKAPLSIVEIDSEGNSKKSLLAISGDLKVIARPTIFKQLTNGEMLLYGKLKGRQRYGKLTMGETLSYH